MHRKSHYLSQINVKQVLTKQICEKNDNILYWDFHIYLVRWAKNQRPNYFFRTDRYPKYQRSFLLD